MSDTFWLPAGFKDRWNPTNDKNLWDTIVFPNGIEFYGVVDVQGDGGYDIDAKKPREKSAARLEYGGYKAFDVTLTLKIITAEHWDIWENKLYPLIRPINSTDKPKAFTVAHPALRSVGVRALVLKSVSVPKSDGQNGPGKQIKEVVLKCIQYLPIEWRHKEKDGSGSNSDKTVSGEVDLLNVQAKVNEWRSNHLAAPGSQLTLLGGYLKNPLYKKAAKQKDGSKSKGYNGQYLQDQIDWSFGPPAGWSGDWPPM